MKSASVFVTLAVFPCDWVFFFFFYTFQGTAFRHICAQGYFILFWWLYLFVTRERSAFMANVFALLGSISLPRLSFG